MRIRYLVFELNELIWLLISISFKWDFYFLFNVWFYLILEEVILLV